MIHLTGDAELDELAAQAASIAETIAATPKQRAYVTAVVYAALTTDCTIELQGLRLTFPACDDAGALEQAARLISWETMLPFIRVDTTEAQAKALAVRLRGLADVCDQYRQPPQTPLFAPDSEPLDPALEMPSAGSPKGADISSSSGRSGAGPSSPG